MSKSLVDYVIEEIADTQDMSVKDAAKLFVKQSEHAVDFDNLPKQNHSWTDRGAKMTCENAGHPYHEAWKPRRATV